MQKVLIVSTKLPNVRDSIISWNSENPDHVYTTWLKHSNKYECLNELPVGLIGGLDHWSPSYPTVFHALGDGWRLLNSPIKHYEREFKDGSDRETNVEYYEWWLVKD